MYVIQLRNVYGDVVTSTTMDNLSDAHQAALDHGWPGARVQISEGLEEADGQMMDLEVVYEYYLDNADYSAGEGRQRPFEGNW